VDRVKVELIQLRKKAYCRVVITSVIEEELTKLSRVNIKLLQYNKYNLSHTLAGVGARQLRQRDR
jgi:hypothetical protein